MKSRDVIAILKAHGWFLKRVTGSHHHYMHMDHSNIVTVPHPRRDIPLGTLKSIEKQSGLTLRSPHA
jgi:predicted RNA binding protein YcfA (HicA-like mRNA interferase family)